jgi:hypothetical protein
MVLRITRLDKLVDTALKKTKGRKESWSREDLARAESRISRSEPARVGQWISGLGSFAASVQSLHCITLLSQDMHTLRVSSQETCSDNLLTTPP